jgi:heterodisulfide reductase subunit B
VRPVIATGEAEMLCTQCKTVTQRLTRADMVNKMRAFFSSEPPSEISTKDANTVKVFVEHHLGEAEASLDSIREHIRITGKLPEVGGSIYTLPRDMPHKAFAIPIAKVVRIEPVH